LTLFEGTPELALKSLAIAASNAIAQGSRIGIFVASEEVEAVRRMLSGTGHELYIQDAGSSSDPAIVASRLYAGLRTLDTRQVDLILARTLSAEQGLGLAIRDRLRRAAAGRIVRC
jgi:L-threonylcarbamoyladenylate synthase